MTPATPGQPTGSWWPGKDAPGRYEIQCSCQRWKFTGTAPEIHAASRDHDDSPGRGHVVTIAHGGRRVDVPDPNVPDLDAGPHDGEAAYLDDQIGGQT